MKNYNNPEMKIASFDKEAVAVTASTFQQQIDEWVEEKAGRQSTNINYQNLQDASFEF